MFNRTVQFLKVQALKLYGYMEGNIAFMYFVTQNNF